MKRRLFFLFTVIFLISEQLDAMHKSRGVTKSALRSNFQFAMLRHNLPLSSLHSSEQLTKKEIFTTNQRSKLLSQIPITSTKVTAESNQINSIGKCNLGTALTAFVIWRSVKHLIDIYDDNDVYSFNVDPNDPWCQVNQGIVHSQKGDTEKAKHYYSLAANQGYSIGQYNLGVLNFKEGNIEEALRNYSLAANQGETSALIALWEYYQNTGNIEKAKHYYSLAAAKNCLWAQKRLDTIYQDGKDNKTTTICNAITDNQSFKEIDSNN